MVKTIIPGRADIELFVKSIFDEFGNILKEEHINKTDKLKTYRDYDNGDEVKFELANMLEDFAYKYETNDYIRRVDFHSSRKEGLSNYIEITFNTPFGSKEWLKHLRIRISDHPKRNGRKVDEYVSIEGNSVNGIEKELDRIVNKRIRRIEREYNLPMAQNENIERNEGMKLRINESINDQITVNLYSLEKFIKQELNSETYDFSIDNVEIYKIVRDNCIKVEVTLNNVDNVDDISICRKLSKSILNTAKLYFSKKLLVRNAIVGFFPKENLFNYEGKDTYVCEIDLADNIATAYPD